MFGWWQRLKERWGIASDARMAKIWVVFALTGSASAWVARPVTEWLGMADWPAWQRIPLRILLIFPVYQLTLITLGTLAGERRWYLWFLRKMWRLDKVRSQK